MFGFPCQDISPIGTGAGIEGKRSGLWKEMARIVCILKRGVACQSSFYATPYRVVSPHNIKSYSWCPVRDELISSS
ncbi:MAG: DNA cytosine methyltransferase [Azovibrio sp.]